MSTIKSSDEHLTLNADGSSKDIKFQANGVEKASIDSSGNLTVSGNLTSVGIDDNADATAITIDSNENVGIGATSPTSKLDVTGDAKATRLVGRGFLENSSGVSGDTWAVMGLNTTNAAGSGGAVFGSKHADSNSLLVGTHDATFNSFVVKGDGKVGIGTTSPQKNLHIFETEGGVGAKHATIRLGGYSNVGAEISAFRVDGNSNNQGLIFSSNHSSNGIQECLKVWNNSSTGPGFTVGGTYNTNGSDKIYSCHIENNVIGHRNVAKLTDAQTHWRFFNPNGQVGNINTSGSGTSYVTSSDYRLKENVDYTWDATTRLKQLKPCRFNFIADGTNTLVDGFIAHEVSSVVPEAISGEKDAMTAEVLYAEGDELPEGKSVGDVKTAAEIDPQGIDQSKLVPLLVKTIQELEARITALES